MREEDFVRFWKACVSGRSPAQRLLAALKRSADGHAAEPPLDETSFLVAADWELMMQELLATHPGASGRQALPRPIPPGFAVLAQVCRSCSERPNTVLTTRRV